MDEKYDAIVLGTGLIECILSGLLSVSGKKVLQTDKNAYYGSESTSFNLVDLYKHFGEGDPPAEFGQSRDYCVDLILKLILSSGELVDILVALGVDRYLSFQLIGGSYIYRDNQLYKVPSNESEVLKSGFLGLFQKKYLYSFFSDISHCDVSKHQVPPKLTANMPMDQVYTQYGLNDANKDLVGHVIALYQDDDYLKKPCIETIKRIVIYKSSLQRYGMSPYVYPQYGLGELPQSFARLSAVYGGTFMLNTAATGLEFGEDGKVTGVKYGDKVVKTDIVIGDPSYFPDRTRPTKKAVRCICILQHNVKAISPCASAQIIIPGSQVKRKSDIYVSVISHNFNICPKEVSIGIVATVLETTPEKDIELALKILSPIAKKFVWVSDMYEPLDDGTASNVFISHSYDATTNFSSVVEQIRTSYKHITGSELDIEHFKKLTKREE